MRVKIGNIWKYLAEWLVRSAFKTISLLLYRCSHSKGQNPDRGRCGWPEGSPGKQLPWPQCLPTASGQMQNPSPWASACPVPPHLPGSLSPTPCHPHHTPAVLIFCRVLGHREQKRSHSGPWHMLLSPPRTFSLSRSYWQSCSSFIS